MQVPSVHKIYVLQRDSLVKIGRSYSPQQRAKVLRATVAYQSNEALTELNAACVERAALKLLRPYRVLGEREWFSVSLEIAIDAVRRAFVIAA